MVQTSYILQKFANIIPALIVGQVSAEICDGGHTCSTPKKCCTFGCCYNNPTQMDPSYQDMLTYMMWFYWTAAILTGLTVGVVCGYWLWKCRKSSTIEDSSLSERTSSISRHMPPDYSRCNSFVQAMPPPYNEVTAKPDLYPLVIGYDNGFGNKGASGFVMRYFRSLSHASTLDSLSSSFMCNVVNEANNIIPPPYSCNNSNDQLSIDGCGRTGNIDDSIVSLVNQRTVSEISSLAPQFPSSPPRATSPTLELRELLDKIHQLPQLSSEQESSYQFPSHHYHLDQGQFLYSFNRERVGQQHQTLSSTGSDVTKFKRTRGKLYMPIGQSSAKDKAKRWLSRSAPTTPSGTTMPMPFLPNQSRRPSDFDGNNQQVVPLLSEQDETENNNTDNISETYRH